MPTIVPGASPLQLRVYAFVDGGHVRAGLDKLSVAWTTVNLREVVSVGMQGVGTWRGGAMALSRIFVYDAVLDDTKAEEPSVESWLRRNDDLPDVHVRRGHLAGDRRTSNPRRQKGVDVQLAVDALAGAFNSTYDVALLLAGDADFAPVVEAVRDRGPLVVACAFRSQLSAVLQEACDRVVFLPDEPAAWDGWRLPPS